MSDFWKMAKLDFFTMKSQSVVYVTLAIIIVMFGLLDSTVVLLGMTGAWFVALMSTNIFSLQENNHLDRLYGSLPIQLEDIVLGRYAFVMLNYLISFLIVIGVYLTFALLQNKAFEWLDIALAFSLSFLVFSAITAIQLPLFFKMGYTKAKAWSMIPFVAVIALVMVPSFVSRLSEVVAFMQSNQPVLITSSILASCIFQILSWRTAVVAYRKSKRG